MDDRLGEEESGGRHYRDSLWSTLLIISGWLGQDTVVTWLSGTESLMGKFTKVATFGHPHPCWRPSIGMGVSKVELTTYHLVAVASCDLLTFFPVTSPTLGSVLSLFSIKSMQLNKHLLCVNTALYCISTLWLPRWTSHIQYWHPKGSFCSREFGLMNVQLSKCYNLYVMMLMGSQKKMTQFSWGNWEEHLRKDIRWGGCQRMSGT